MRPTKVVFPNGSIDPWHALSFTTNVDPTAFTTIYIDGKLYFFGNYRFKCWYLDKKNI